jgi:hypothetical protein
LLGLLSLILVPFGAFVLIRGLRGRVIGDDPHCRTCRFNLRGRDPSSTRCPECGTELTPASVRVGLRQRRPVMIVVGISVFSAGFSVLALAGIRAATAKDWTPWKPTSWLLADLDSATPAARTLATNELARRAAAPGASQAKVDAIIDGLLARQADPTRPWTQSYGSIIDKAALANRVDRQRLERYLKQGVSGRLTLKPRLRRGQGMSIELDLKLDRFGPDRRLRGTWHADAVTVGGQTLVEPKWASHSAGNEELSWSIGYISGVDGRTWKGMTVPDGVHQARTSVAMKIEMLKPVAIGPVEHAVPLSTSVELVPADANVDVFEADPTKRDEMNASIHAARVGRRKGSEHLDVRLKVGKLPVAVAADVFLAQNGAEQKAGAIRLDAARPPRWAEVRTWQKPRFTAGTVDVILRPSQAAADGQRTLDVYWGEPIVIKDVLIDAPYVPPLNNDMSHRAAVEKALAACKVRRTEQGGLHVTLSAPATPVKLAYDVTLLRGGSEYVVDSCWTATSNGRSSSSYTCDDRAPELKSQTCDLIFRPSPDWEIRTWDGDATPPWGGEVILRDVPIAPASTPSR